MLGHLHVCIFEREVDETESRSLAVVVSTPLSWDSVHDVNAENRPFSARIGSQLVIVYLMALLPPHTKHKFRLVYGGLMNDVEMMFEGFHNLYGTQPPVKTASTSGSLRVIGDH